MKKLGNLIARITTPPAKRKFFYHAEKYDFESSLRTYRIKTYIPWNMP